MTRLESITDVVLTRHSHQPDRAALPDLLGRVSALRSNADGLAKALADHLRHLDRASGSWGALHRAEIACRELARGLA
jgi:hypothetical protein